MSSKKGMDLAQLAVLRSVEAEAAVDSTGDVQAEVGET